MKYSRAWPPGVVLLVMGLGCSGEGPEQAEGVGPASFGALALQLQLPDVELDQLTYTVTREGSVKRSGTFVVEGFRGTFRAVLGALPQADDYDLLLSGLALELETRTRIECTTGAAFAVTRKQTTGLSLRLYCGDEPELPAAPGSPVSPSGKRCPEVELIRATPGEAQIGIEVKLLAEVTHLDEVPAVIYAWSSDIGLFTQAVSGSAKFKCTQPGTANVELDISFSDGERTCPKQSGSVQVICREITNGAGGSGAAGAGGRSGF